jgi:hypothetical protein
MLSMKPAATARRQITVAPLTVEAFIARIVFSLLVVLPAYWSAILRPFREPFPLAFSGADS